MHTKIKIVEDPKIIRAIILKHHNINIGTKMLKIMISTNEIETGLR